MAAVFLLIKIEPKSVLILLLVYKEANTPAENDDTTSLRNDSPLPVRVSTQAKYFKFLKSLLLRQYKSRSMCHAYQQAYISPRLGESGIREIYAYGAYGIRNPGLWNPENSSRNPESHQRLVSGSQVPLTKNPESRIQVSWIPLHIILVKLRNNKQKKFKNKIRSVINEQKIIIRC